MYFFLLKKMGPAERCSDLWLILNILRKRTYQKTPSILSRAKSLTWKGTNYRTIFNLLIFTARKKGSLRNPEFLGFQFRSSRDPECRFMNKLLYSIETWSHPSTTKFVSLLSPVNSPMQSLSSQNLSPWILTKSHFHIFPPYFFSPTITFLSLQLVLVVLHVFCCWKSSTIISIHNLRKPTNSPA